MMTAGSPGPRASTQQLVWATHRTSESISIVATVLTESRALSLRFGRKRADGLNVLHHAQNSYGT